MYVLSIESLCMWDCKIHELEINGTYRLKVQSNLVELASVYRTRICLDCYHTSYTCRWPHICLCQHRKTHFPEYQFGNLQNNFKKNLRYVFLCNFNFKIYHVLYDFNIYCENTLFQVFQTLKFQETKFQTDVVIVIESFRPNDLLECIFLRTQIFWKRFSNTEWYTRVRGLKYIKWHFSLIKMIISSVTDMA